MVHSLPVYEFRQGTVKFLAEQAGKVAAVDVELLCQRSQTQVGGQIILDQGDGTSEDGRILFE